MNGKHKLIIRTIVISLVIGGGSLLNISSASAAPASKPAVKATPAPAPSPKPAPIPVLIAKPTPPPTSPPPPTKVAELPSFMPWTVAPSLSPTPNSASNVKPPVTSPESNISQTGLSTGNKVAIGITTVGALVGLSFAITGLVTAVTATSVLRLVTAGGGVSAIASAAAGSTSWAYTSAAIASVAEMVSRVTK